MAEKNKFVNDVKFERKTLSKWLTDFLFSDTIPSIGAYLANSIIKPAINDVLYRSIVGAAGMAIYHTTKDINPGSYNNDNPLARRYAGTQKAYTPYNQIGYQPYGEYYAPNATNMYNMLGPKPNEISFGTRDLALLRLNQLKETLAQYQRLSVKQFYNVLEMTPPIGNWAIDTAGWYSLEGTEVVPTTSGRWMLTLPPIVQLN